MKPKYQQSVTFQRARIKGDYRLVSATGVTEFEMGQIWRLEEVEKYCSNHPDVKVILKDAKS